MAVQFNANPPKVKELIESATLVMIEKEWCPFCIKAKAAIANYVNNDHPQYKILKLEDMNGKPLIPNVSKYQDEMAKLSGGSRSVPKVFLNSKLLGGGDEVQALHQSGQLRQMFIDAGLVKVEPVSPLEPVSPPVAELIKSAKLVMISLEWCPICDRAKNAIANYVDRDHPQYKVFELEDMDHTPLVPDVEKYRQELTQLFGSRTVPKVFLEGQLLGGADDSEALHKSGKLRKMLIDAGMVSAADFPDSNSGVQVEVDSMNVRYFINGKIQTAKSFKQLQTSSL